MISGDGGCKYHCDGVAGWNDSPGKDDIVSYICEHKADSYHRDGGMNSAGEIAVGIPHFSYD